jgi:hypothetical protein
MARRVSAEELLAALDRIAAERKPGGLRLDHEDGASADPPPAPAN